MKTFTLMLAFCASVWAAGMMVHYGSEEWDQLTLEQKIKNVMQEDSNSTKIQEVRDE